MSARQRRGRGFSLVELMIAMVLGLVLVGGVMQIYLSTRAAYRMQDAVMRRQENLRYLLHVLTRDVRMAGYRGCLRDTGRVVNTLNSASDFLYNFNVPVEGANATGAAWSPALDAGLSNVVPGTDVLTLRSSQEPELFLTKEMPSTSASLETAPSSPYPFAVGDILLVSDCAGAAVMQLTNVQTSSPAQATLVHNTGATPPVPGNATQNLGRRYPVGTQVSRIRTLSYYVRESARGTGPALWRREGDGTSNELAEGVDDLQLLFGEDTDADRVPDFWRKASAVIDWRQVTALRIGLLVSGTSDDVGDADPRVFEVLDERVGPFTDRRSRSVITTTVSLRNRLP